MPLKVIPAGRSHFKTHSPVDDITSSTAYDAYYTLQSIIHKDHNCRI